MTDRRSFLKGLLLSPLAAKAVISGVASAEVKDGKVVAATIPEREKRFPDMNRVTKNPMPGIEEIRVDREIIDVSDGAYVTHIPGMMTVMVTATVPGAAGLNTWEIVMREGRKETVMLTQRVDNSGSGISRLQAILPGPPPDGKYEFFVRRHHD